MEELVADTKAEKAAAEKREKTKVAELEEKAKQVKDPMAQEEVKVEKADQKAAKAISEATPQGQGPSPRWVWFLGCLCVMQWILLAIKWGNRTKISQ